MNKLLNFTVLSVLAFIVACSGENKQGNEKINNEDSLGLITANVASDKDVLGEMPRYSEQAPGSAEVLDRSFENAPPLIPHSIEGLVPVTKDNNMCMTCHMPDVAAAMKSTPVPESHMTDYRPPVNPHDKSVAEDEKNLVVEKNLNGKLSMARYNCTQCHVPQANIDPAVQNTFKSVFRDKKLKNGSNLNKTIEEGVK